MKHYFFMRGAMLPVSAIMLFASSSVSGQNIEKLTVSAQSIEKLSKKDKEFYGRQVSKTEFLTCDNTRVQIEDGHIVGTHRKCPEQPPISATFVYGAKVLEYTTSTDSSGAKVGELKFQTREGVTSHAFVPSTVVHQTDATLLQPNKKVSVLLGVEGRAEVIRSDLM